MVRRSAAAVLALACGSAHAANVYALSSGDTATDSAMVSALTARGHSVTVGVQYGAFDGTVSLAGFQTVYLQANFNWNAGVMPPAGQQQLTSWVTSGGRLVTCEWVNYYTYAGGKFAGLEPIMPVVNSFSYGTTAGATYDVAIPDPAINAGVPAALTFPLTSYTGTELYTTAKAGATVYYTTQSAAGAPGLTGWAQGAGAVYSFSTTCGPDQVGDPNFGRLLANVMGAAGVSCYPNCDASTVSPVLNVQDFTCFLQKFAGADAYANCDGSTTAPTLNVQDFTCFLQKFAAGCP
jgi:hypothetical protein